MPVYYAVLRGSKPGIYRSWNEAKEHVLGYPNAMHKKFSTLEDANNFMNKDESRTPKKVYSSRSSSSSRRSSVIARSSSQHYEKPREIRQMSVSEILSGSKTDENPRLDLSLIGISPLKDKVLVFTDGSGNDGTKGQLGGYGVFSIYPCGRQRVIYGQSPGKTNQNAELFAILTAIRKTKGSLVIKTDSMYSINCIMNWSDNWKRNGWVTTGNEPVKNKEIIKGILKRIEKKSRKGKTVEFLHVNSHSSCKGNNFADKLAGAGRLNQRIVEYGSVNFDK